MLQKKKKKKIYIYIYIYIYINTTIESSIANKSCLCALWLTMFDVAARQVGGAQK